MENIRKCSFCGLQKPIIWNDYAYIPSLSKFTKGRYIGANGCFDCTYELGFPEAKEFYLKNKNKTKECISCDRPYMKIPGKSWIVKCSSCWIKENVGLITIEEVEFKAIAKEKRKINAAQDTEQLQDLRKEWCEKLLIQQLEPMIRVLEMYKDENGEAVKGPLYVPQYFHEYKFCNTRTKLKTETRFEVDKLSWEASIKLIFDVSEELRQKGYSHYVFCSEGSRSPHIIIYNFSELENLNSHYRYKVQENFWRYIAPFHVQYADHSVWFDEHDYVPLEFAPHWKSGNPFILCWEVKSDNIRTAAIA